MICAGVRGRRPRTIWVASARDRGPTARTVISPATTVDRASPLTRTSGATFVLSIAKPEFRELWLAIAEL